MEFWGVEVKPGETIKCDPGEERFLHLSQASLGETKKDKASENVVVFLKFNDQKLVLGTLSGEKCPQFSYNLVFEKEFELSHSSKSMSVYFCGYKSVAAEDGFDVYSESDSEEDDLQPGQNANGKPEVKEQTKSTAGKPNSSKVDASFAKPKKAEESTKADKPKADEDDDDAEDDSEEEESSSDDEDMLNAGDDSDDDDEEDDDASSDEEDATPKKAEISKKRAAGSSSKTPVPEKKAKLISPAGSHKTGGDGKKGGYGHPATPHPAKHVGKTPANNDKSKQQTPKSGGGSVTCKSCTKTFNSDNALQAHTKAKHPTGK